MGWLIVVVRMSRILAPLDETRVAVVEWLDAAVTIVVTSGLMGSVVTK